MRDTHKKFTLAGLPGFGLMRLTYSEERLF
jgi:hypothetical protein